MKFITYDALLFYNGKDGNIHSRNIITPDTIRKIIMRIQIVIFLLLFTAFNINAKIAFAQKVSLNLKNQPLEKAFLAIEKATGMIFWYKADLLKDARPVTVQLNDVAVDHALEACFKSQDLNYEIVGSMIKVTAKPATTKPTTPLPPIRIKGKVTDIKNNPLIGVSVRLRGTNIGTITDENGNYQIEGEPDGVLVFTFVGFQAMQIKINNQIEINLTLIEYTSELKETEIKGYYTTTKELNTGNVRTIKAVDITKQPVSDPLGTLQGRVPGLFIQQSSGVPGRAFQVAIRGQNSIGNGNEPLYIVDGVQFNSTPLNSINLFGGAANTSPLNSISPADIESITILKDADATAIYGSRGANGVILIATKKGSAAGTSFSINSYHGVGSAVQRLKMMNTEEYLAMRKEAFKNDNRQPGVSDYDLNGAYDQNKYTDWQDIMIGGSAEVNELQGALSGGSDRTQFRIGVGYRKEGNVFPGNNYMNKINSLFSITHRSANDRLNIDFSGNYVSGLSKMPPFDMARYLTLAPNSPDIYDNSGNLNWQNDSWTNPFVEIVKKYTERSNNLGGNSRISYKVISGLRIEANIGYNKNGLAQKNINPSTAFSPSTPDPKSARFIMWTNNDVTSWIFEPQINYTAELWEGKIEVLLGSTFQETRQEFISHFVSGFASDEQIESIVAGTTKNVEVFTPKQYRYNAIYGRIGYNFHNKYVLNLTARRDGSSRFGPGRQFGNFGAIGAAWIISNESWLKDDRVVSFAKVRTSYGVTGNDMLGDYKYLSTYTYSNTSYQGYTGLNPTQLTNEAYGWETVNKFEIALESSFLKDRLSLDISYYRNRTGNQLVGYPLPVMTGFATVTANLPAVIQNSGVEVELRSEIIKKGNIKWSANFNVSIPRNRLVSYPNIQNSSNATRYAVGMPLSVSYLYQYTGINPETGLYTFLDKNNDGQITSVLDRTFVKSGIDYFGGLNNSLSYKSFQLDVFLTFVKQTGQNYLFAGSPGNFGSGLGNQTTEVANRSLFQPYSAGSGQILTNNGLFNSSSGRYSDASFVRVKNIMLSWTFPTGKAWNKVLKSGKLFLTGQNLFTITNYKGLDPEIGPALRTPPLRVMAAGININL